MVRKKRFRSSKGISTVIGTIFLVLIVLMVGTNVLLWSLMQNSLYNQTVQDLRQTETDRFSERIATSRANFTVPETGTVQVDLTVSNEGPVSAQIITAWVVWTVEEETTYGFNDTLNINLNPGQSFPLTVTVATPNASSTGAFSGWLVTARGNLVSLEKEKMVVHSQVALGIGSVMMDFDRFKHYIFHSKNQSLTPWDEGIINFTIPSKQDLVFGVLLSNYDQYHRTITLRERSLLWIYFEKAPGQRATWPITKVTSNGTKMPFSPISLAYGESKWIFFGEATPLSGAGAVNLILLGNIDGQDYGQNIPFVSIYVTG